MTTRTMRDVASLRLDPRNARKHPKRSIDEIKSSLLQFGQQKPIVVDASGQVVAGNGTLVAAGELGWTELWAETTTLDPKAAKAYAIVDNRTAELSEWNNDLLVEELESLGVSVSGLGFNDDELAEMRPIVVEDKVDGGEAKDSAGAKVEAFTVAIAVPRASDADRFFRALDKHQERLGEPDRRSTLLRLVMG